VIVAGKHIESVKKEQRADLKIFKDIEIEEQLAIALETVLGNHAAKGQASGK
jgi:hypothetical protein